MASNEGSGDVQVVGPAREETLFRVAPIGRRDSGRRMRWIEYNRSDGRSGNTDPRDAAIDACFDLQTATQAIEPVIVCSDATPVPELVGDRIKVETFPPFTMVVDDPDSVLLLPEGVNVGGNGNFVISSAVQLADPDGTYSEMAITPIVPPDELQDWIDATTVISVVDQGTMSVAEHDSRWWTITGNGEGLELAGSSFVGIFAYDGRDIPQQIGTSDMITIWEIPHPDATVYVFVNNPRELFLDEVRGVLETIAFDV